MAQCSIRLLGGFEVEVDGRAVPASAWRHRRAAELVKVLALASRHRLHREELTYAMWPDLPAPAGSANLRKALHFARRALGSDDAIEAEGGVVELWPGGDLRVDAESFESKVGEALRGADPVEVARAADLYTGELLPEDLYADWAQGPRERLRRLRVKALRAAGQWERVLQMDPVDEEAHRALMQRYLDEGDRTAAMRQFERLREVLRDELGVGPDPRSVELYEQVLALEGIEPSTPAERAASHLSAGLVALNRMDLEEAERQALLARELAVEAGLGLELGEASGLLGMVAHAQGRWREAFRTEFLGVVREAPELAGFVFDAHLCLAEFSLLGTEGPESIGEYARGLENIADRYRSVGGKAVARLMLGESKMLTGDLVGAEEDLSQAAELHGKAGATSGRALSLERLAAAAVARGRRARAGRLLADAHALARLSSLAAHLVVRVCGTRVQASSGTPAAAAEVARTSRKELAGTKVCEPCSIGFLVSSTTAFARAGQLDEAAASLDQAERVAGMWQGGPWLAAAWEARAELRLAGGESRQAAALFREAANLFSRSGHRPAEVRCLKAAEAADAARPVRSRTAKAPARNARGTPAS
jgi:DNA-binding SARP family transcriptional activator